MLDQYYIIHNILTRALVGAVNVTFLLNRIQNKALQNGICEGFKTYKWRNAYG